MPLRLIHSASSWTNTKATRAIGATTTHTLGTFFFIMMGILIAPLNNLDGLKGALGFYILALTPLGTVGLSLSPNDLMGRNGESGFSNVYFSCLS